MYPLEIPFYMKVHLLLLIAVYSKVVKRQFNCIVNYYNIIIYSFHYNTNTTEHVWKGKEKNPFN